MLLGVYFCGWDLRRVLGWGLKEGGIWGGVGSWVLVGGGLVCGLVGWDF